MKTKLKGFLEFQGVLLAILLGFVALSFLQISSGQFAALAASRKALQAQQFAQSEADYLRNVSYDQLSSAAHGKKAISGANGWMSSVSIGNETTVNDVKQRIGTIQVYRNNTVASPDFSLQVPLSSASSKGGCKFDTEGYKTLLSRNYDNYWNSGTWSWTATSDGFLILLGGGNSQNNIQITIDNKAYDWPMTWTSSASSGCGEVHDSVTLPVYKGAKIKVQGCLCVALFLAIK